MSATCENHVGNWQGLPHTTIETFTGHPVDCVNIRPEDIRWADIAHALSLVCRYGGHCRYHYSVAAHSLHCHDEAERRDLGPVIGLAVLLHDAGEAYWGDMTRPQKNAPGMEAYHRWLDDAQRAVEERAGIAGAAAAYAVVVHDIDNAVLKTEAGWLMRSRGRTWAFLDEIVAAPINPQVWQTYLDPEVAETTFLERLATYGLRD